MRTFEEVSRAVVEKRLTEVRCDICMVLIDPHAEALHAGQHQEVVAVEHEHLERLPENRARVRRIALDICGTCFERHLLALVRRASPDRVFSYEEEEW